MSIRAKVRAQRLNDIVTFQRVTRDEYGQVSGWTDLVRDVPAAVDGAKAFNAEKVIANGVGSASNYTVWVRSDVVDRFGPTTHDRIVWKSKVLDIKDDPDQGLRGRLIAFICQAGVSEG